MSKPLEVSTNAYSISGCALSAWLDGSVHGVVVQMTAIPSFLGNAFKLKALAINSN